jgi:hypothetical protein
MSPTADASYARLRANCGKDIQSASTCACTCFFMYCACGPSGSVGKDHATSGARSEGGHEVFYPVPVRSSQHDAVRRHVVTRRAHLLPCPPLLKHLRPPENRPVAPSHASYTSRAIAGSRLDASSVTSVRRRCVHHPLTSRLLTDEADDAAYVC